MHGKNMQKNGPLCVWYGHMDISRKRTGTFGGSLLDCLEVIKTTSRQGDQRKLYPEGGDKQANDKYRLRSQSYN